MFADGVLIPVKQLVNGDTVAQHDVLFAEGLPAESYLDTGNRAGFGDGGAVVDLVADFARHETLAWEAACAPLVVTGPVLDAVRRRLARRAAQRKPIESQGTAATRMTARSSAPR